MSCMDLLFQQNYEYSFKCFSNNCKNKNIKMNFKNLNKLIYVSSQWEVINVCENTINGYCIQCKKLREKKTEEQLKLTISEVKYLTTEIERLKNINSKSENENKNHEDFINKLLKNLKSKLMDKNYLKSIYLETTKPCNISWDTIDYILRHTENLTQEELDKMSNIQKMQLV